METETEWLTERYRGGWDRDRTTDGNTINFFLLSFPVNGDRGPTGLIPGITYKPFSLVTDTMAKYTSVFDRTNLLSKNN
jgi:hypothetical protein